MAASDFLVASSGVQKTRALMASVQTTRTFSGNSSIKAALCCRFNSGSCHHVITNWFTGRFTYSYNH